MEWSPYSLYLNPIDFFLWGFDEDRCYASKPKSREQLQQAIRSTMSAINEDSLLYGFYSFKERLEFCSTSDGGHFENIIH